MKHEQSDYNKRVKCVDGSIPNDEPVFLLRGKDREALRVIQFWVFLKRIPGNEGISEKKAASVLKHAKKMWDYSCDYHYSPGC